MPGALVTDQLKTNNQNVRKHLASALFIADYATPVPANLFEETTAGGFITSLPTVLAAGWRAMGFTTTDGVSHGSDVSNSDVNANEEAEPIRSDLESITRTIGVTFLEASAWTQGLAHMRPVSEWPTVNGPDWKYRDIENPESPFYRALYLSQDGKGDARILRAELYPMVKVTDLGDRSTSRTATEDTEVTLTAYRDPLLGYSRDRQSVKYKRAVAV